MKKVFQRMSLLHQCYTVESIEVPALHLRSGLARSTLLSPGYFLIDTWLNI